MVLGEVVLDVLIADMDLARHRLLEYELLTEDVLDVLFRQVLRLQNLIELSGRVLGLDVVFFLLNGGIGNLNVVVLGVLIDQHPLDEGGEDLTGARAVLEFRVEFGLRDILAVDGGDGAAAAAAAGTSVAPGEDGQAEGDGRETDKQA